MDPQKVQDKYGSGVWSRSRVDSPHKPRWDIDGTGAGVDPQKVKHKYGSGVDPLHDLRWDIDGTGALGRVDPQKVQHKYGSGAGSRSGVDPQQNLTWDIDGTRAIDGVDPKLRLKSYNTNVYLKLDPDTELTPQKVNLSLVLMVIKTLDGSSCKICIIITSATYMRHTYEKS